MNNIIVVIDDCELLKWSLMKILPHYADTIQYYDNLLDALQALNQAKDTRYILIVDLEIATLSGINTLIKKLAVDRYNLILLTSMLSAYNEQDIHCQGVVKIFTKPFNINELTDLILTLI